jgi:acetyltransferase-like isoleucine patch superfamily enzyme
MSMLSEFWKRHRYRWYRRGIDEVHNLRRHLAYYVRKHGFEIGDYSYGTPTVRSWGEGSRLIVGKYCSIGPDVEFILGGNHHAGHVTTFPMSLALGTDRTEDTAWSRGDIVIGSDVWIGAGAAILSGVTIGDGAIIGARAVVTRDVEPYAVVAGNPAAAIRRRFSDPIVQDLLELRWWDLSRDQLLPLLPLMRSNRVERFIEACRKYRHTGLATAPALATEPADTHRLADGSALAATPSVVAR